MSETAHHGHEGHAHGTWAHHFDSHDQQREASTFGMWLFLVTEVMFFGGFFLAYIIYRSRWPQDFAIASHELNAILGGIKAGAETGEVGIAEKLREIDRFRPHARRRDGLIGLGQSGAGQDEGEGGGHTAGEDRGDHGWGDTL